MKEIQIFFRDMYAYYPMPILVLMGIGAVLFLVFLFRKRFIESMIFVLFIGIVMGGYEYFHFKRVKAASRYLEEGPDEDFGVRYEPYFLESDYRVPDKEAEEEVISNLMQEGVIDQELHDKAVGN